MSDLLCRCTGKDRGCECPEMADQEDGLCADCRWGDGRCCEGRSFAEMDARNSELERRRRSGKGRVE